MNRFEIQLSLIKELNIPLDKYVICGGLALEAHGVRKNKADLDLLVKHDVYELISTYEGWAQNHPEWSNNGAISKIVEVPHLHNGTFKIEVLCEDTFNNVPRINEYIKEREVLYDLPFINVSNLLEWKKCANRSKDQADINSIQSFLANQQFDQIFNELNES